MDSGCEVAHGKLQGDRAQLITDWRGRGNPVPFSMAKKLLDRDPVTGNETWFDYDHHRDQAVLTEVQPVAHVLDYCANLRQISGERTKRQMKKDWVHYAILPSVVQLEMKLKHGVDPWGKADEHKRYALINTEYSRFKVTNIVHNTRKR